MMVLKKSDVYLEEYAFPRADSNLERSLALISYYATSPGGFGILRRGSDLLQCDVTAGS